MVLKLTKKCMGDTIRVIKRKEICSLSLTAAFTLVELAIVLIIMGALVAATMAGSELLKITRLKSLISEAESYKVALDNFKTQYENLPGDIPNATSFWTTAQNGGSVAVQNGNGNGQIGVAGSTLTGFALESYFIWNHLTLSKFLPGTFLGNSTAVATMSGATQNVPASKYLDGAGISINYHSAPFAYVDVLNRNFPGNYINIGATSTDKNYLSANILKPEDAYYIDSKIDDGTPKFGKILSGDGPSYTGGACVTGAAYNLTSLTVACIMLLATD